MAIDFDNLNLGGITVDKGVFKKPLLWLAPLMPRSLLKG